MVASHPQVIAGSAVLAASVVITLGITTAEALYPGYSTTTQTISALGATTAPLASQLVFNGAMILAGGLLFGMAIALRVSTIPRSVPDIAAVTGVIGFAGVGLFPEQTGVPHVLAAGVAFGGTGLLALVVARVAEGPFGYVSGVLGLSELLVFAVFVGLQGETALGIGGLERWVAYLAILWAASYGGVLLTEPAE